MIPDGWILLNCPNRVLFLNIENERIDEKFNHKIHLNK